MHDATQYDLCRGFFHACVVRCLMQQNRDPSQSWELVEKVDICKLLQDKGWNVLDSHLGDTNARLMD